MSNHHVAPLLESLEQRSLLSATLQGTELHVTGSSKSDLITVYYDAKDKSKLDVKIRTAVTQFNASDVASLRIEGLAGDDRILINGANGAVNLPSKIYGGLGDDSNTGGSGRDRVYSGAGDDSVSGESGNDILYGEQGHDTVQGARGRDLLDGGADDDTVIGNAGDDRCHGG